MEDHARPRLTWLGHATVRCDLPGGEAIWIDPWLSNNPACPAEMKTPSRVDAILLTHAHFDHMGDAVALAQRHQPKAVVANFEICSWLASKGIANTIGMNLGGTVDVLGTQVSMVRADHSSCISDGDALHYGGLASGLVVRLPGGFTFYHAGDTALFSDMQLIGALYQPELAFLPSGGHFTMDPRQVAWACRYLGVRQVVPIHWGTFPILNSRPEDVAREIAALGLACEVLALEPGGSL